VGRNVPRQQFRELRSVWHSLARFANLPPRRIGQLLRETYEEWTRKRCDRHGAALAFYTIFSLAPLLIVVVAVAGVFFGSAAARGQIVWQLQELIGLEGGEFVQSILKSADRPAQGVWATIVSVLTLAMGASIVVAELRDSLNTIWDRPADGVQSLLREVAEMVRRRIFAFTLVLGIGLLLLVSLVLNAAISAAGSYFQEALPLPEMALQIFNFAISLVVTSAVFALVFRFVPDAKVRWGEIAAGAILTGILFSIGKSLISLYLGKSSLGSAYGAAGSLAILLAWFYYSSLIFFFGAVFVRVYGRMFPED
jgi:membrane protein